MPKRQHQGSVADESSVIGDDDAQPQRPEPKPHQGAQQAAQERPNQPFTSAKSSLAFSRLESELIARSSI